MDRKAWLGYSTWGHKESDVTEGLTFIQYIHIYIYLFINPEDKMIRKQDQQSSCGQLELEICHLLDPLLSLLFSQHFSP